MLSTYAPGARSATSTAVRPVAARFPLSTSRPQWSITRKAIVPDPAACKKRTSTAGFGAITITELLLAATLWLARTSNASLPGLGPTVPMLVMLPTKSMLKSSPVLKKSVVVV